MSVFSFCNFANEERALESYSVLSQTASLPDENETQDGRDGRLGEGEEEEGRLHSSAHLLSERDTHKMHALGTATGLKRRDRGRICVSTTMFPCCSVILCSSAKIQRLPPRNCSPHRLWMVLGEKRGVSICSADAFSSSLLPSLTWRHLCSTLNENRILNLSLTSPSVSCNFLENRMVCRSFFAKLTKTEWPCAHPPTVVCSILSLHNFL